MARPNAQPNWLDSLKRRAYVAALTLVATAALLGFGLDALRNYPLPVRLIYGPIAAVVALCVALALGSRRLALRFAEAIAYGLAALLLLLHVAIMFLVPMGAEAGLRFAAFAPWIAGVFMLGFLMLETKSALYAALALYLALLLLAGTSVLARGFRHVAHFELNALVQQFVFANGFYIMLLYVMARAKEEYGKAEYRSSVMDQLAHHDELTGCPNRRFLVAACSKEIERLKRHERPFSLVIADLDHFKWVNDTYGHAVGDAVLKSVAGLLSQPLRRGDDLGRIGGEEFVVLAYDADPQTGVALAERLRAALQDADWSKLNLPPVTASFGVANYRAGDVFDSLLDRADQALYRAKHRGRNCVALAA